MHQNLSKDPLPCLLSGIRRSIQAHHCPQHSEDPRPLFAVVPLQICSNLLGSRGLDGTPAYVYFVPLIIANFSLGIKLIMRVFYSLRYLHVGVIPVIDIGLAVCMLMESLYSLKKASYKLAQFILTLAEVTPCTHSQKFKQLPLFFCTVDLPCGWKEPGLLGTSYKQCCPTA